LERDAKLTEFVQLWEGQEGDRVEQVKNRRDQEEAEKGWETSSSETETKKKNKL
jgi:hypothetical protein